MTSAKVERQRVYLAYRKLFAGSNARVRSKKAILRIIRASQPSGPLDEQNLKQKTIPLLRSLLSDRVFEIEEVAKIDFPELWATSCPEQKPGETTKESNEASQASKKLDTAAPDIIIAATPRDEKNDKRRLSFQLDAKSFKFSYNIQHRILETIQQILETTCYDFTRAWFPDVLEDRAWSCAAALELTKWLYVMNERVDTLPETCIDEVGRATFKKIRPRLALLRHSAVHRLHLEHSALIEQVHAALVLTDILRDRGSKAKLQTVCTCLEGIVTEKNQDAEALHRAVNDELLAIEKQREGLDRREQQLRASAATQISRISAEADQSLLGCIVDQLVTSRLGSGGEKDMQRNSTDIYVDENDIESDEDQLQADLG